MSFSASLGGYLTQFNQAFAQAALWLILTIGLPRVASAKDWYFPLGETQMVVGYQAGLLYIGDRSTDRYLWSDRSSRFEEAPPVDSPAGIKSPEDGLGHEEFVQAFGLEGRSALIVLGKGAAILIRAPGSGALKTHVLRTRDRRPLVILTNANDGALVSMIGFDRDGLFLGHDFTATQARALSVEELTRTFKAHRLGAIAQEFGMKNVPLSVLDLSTPMFVLRPSLRLADLAPTKNPEPPRSLPERGRTSVDKAEPLDAFGAIDLVEAGADRFVAVFPNGRVAVLRDSIERGLTVVGELVPPTPLDLSGGDLVRPIGGASPNAWSDAVRVAGDSVSIKGLSGSLSIADAIARFRRSPPGGRKANASPTCASILTRPSGRVSGAVSEK